MNLMEKLAKILLFIFIAVFSFTVLTRKIPEMEFIQSTVEHLEKNQNTVMAFSGTTLGISLAISALPDDFASPLANTVSDLNTYMIILFAIIFVEKLIVIEGTNISLTYIIPIACLLFIISILTAKVFFRNFAYKLMILGIALVLVIPVSTGLTKTVCKDYTAYVDETIAESDAGASKINEVMSSGNEESTFFDKLSDAFKTSIQSVSDLLTYFENVIKKCVNSVAILLVTNFALPLLTLMFFRWLLKELFGLHLSISGNHSQLRLPSKRTEPSVPVQNESCSTEDEL